MPPDRPVIVFDGECTFCRTQIERIRRRDRDQQFEYLPRRSSNLDARFPELSDSDFNTGLRLIEPDGAIHVGAEAISHIAAHLPRWRRLAWLNRVPGLKQLFRSGYAWIARNRHRLG